MQNNSACLFGASSLDAGIDSTIYKIHANTTEPLTKFRLNNVRTCQIALWKFRYNGAFENLSLDYK